MRYVIGTSICDFIRIKSCTLRDGHEKLWNEIDKVSYDCGIEEATIINGHDKARELLYEIQNRVSEIDFSNISIIGEILDEGREFDKADYVKKLKIFRLVPTLVEE